MKLFRFLGVLCFCVLSARADLPVRVVTTGLGVIALAEPVSREALGEWNPKGVRPCYIDFERKNSFLLVRLTPRINAF